MNTKQKLLTWLALIVFLGIGALHYAHSDYYIRVHHLSIVKSVIVPWIMLAVTYAALFVLLKSGKELPYDDDDRIVIWKWIRENCPDRNYDEMSKAVNDHFFAGQAKQKWIDDIL